MRKTIHKCFWVWDYDKEEAWLNRMSANGLALISVGFCRYTFDECTPGEYTYRLDFLENLAIYNESERYIKFVEETGAEYLGSLGRWVYFRKASDDNDFLLYSDHTSRIKYLNRILLLLGIGSLSNLIIALSNFCAYLSMDSNPNLVCGIICLCVFFFLGYGFTNISLKKKKLKKEQFLFEK